MTARSGCWSASQSMTWWPSASVWSPYTPVASMPGMDGRFGTAPVATTSWSKGTGLSTGPSVASATSRTATVRRSRSIPMASVCNRTSMPRARCCSGVRAIRSSRSWTAPLTQYGIPQAEYDVHGPRSSATISMSRPACPAVRCAWDAALIPAASPPMTTSRSDGLMNSLSHNPLTDPVVHRDRRGRSGVDGSGGAELGDGQHQVEVRASVFGQPWAFLPEQQQAVVGQLGGLQWVCAGEVIDADDRQPVLARVLQELGRAGMVPNVLVPVGDHGPSAVPATAADDVDLLGEEGVGGAHDGADVEVVLPVLDPDVKGVPAFVEIGDDGLVPPVAVPVDDVAVVTVAQQLGIESVVVGPRALPRADTRSARLGDGVVGIAHKPRSVAS